MNSAAFALDDRLASVATHEFAPMKGHLYLN